MKLPYIVIGIHRWSRRVMKRYDIGTDGYIFILFFSCIEEAFRNSGILINKASNSLGLFKWMFAAQLNVVKVHSRKNSWVISIVSFHILHKGFNLDVTTEKVTLLMNTRMVLIDCLHFIKYPNLQSEVKPSIKFRISIHDLHKNIFGKTHKLSQSQGLNYSKITSSLKKEKLFVNFRSTCFIPLQHSLISYPSPTHNPQVNFYFMTFLPNLFLHRLISFSKIFLHVRGLVVLCCKFAKGS